MDRRALRPARRGTRGHDHAAPAAVQRNGRRTSMTLHNPVKERLSKGLPTVGQWVSLPAPSIVELLASYQMDWLTLDTEHGAIDTDMLEHMVRAMKGTEVVPIVRVGGNDPVLIKRG